MNELNEERLKEINGGGIGGLVMTGIGVAITFVIGLISGYVNPKKCSN